MGELRTDMGMVNYQPGDLEPSHVGYMKPEDLYRMFELALPTFSWSRGVNPLPLIKTKKFNNKLKSGVQLSVVPVLSLAQVHIHLCRLQ